MMHVGKLFHMFVPATGKACHPTVDRWKVGKKTCYFPEALSILTPWLLRCNYYPAAAYRVRQYLVTSGNVCTSVCMWNNSAALWPCGEVCGRVARSVAVWRGLWCSIALVHTVKRSQAVNKQNLKWHVQHIILTVCMSVDSALATSTKTSASRQNLSIQLSMSGDTSMPGLHTVTGSVVSSRPTCDLP